MAKTMQVIADRKDRPDDIVAAGEVLDLQFRDGSKTLTLRASKLLHLLVDVAGEEACDDKVHAVPIERLNDAFHLSREDFLETCRELFGTTVRMEIKTKRGKATKVGPLLADVERDEEGGSEIRFQLSPVLRLVLARSNHWGLLSRRAIMAFESRYALRLYEIISLRKSMSLRTKETFTIEELRHRLGVPHGKMTRWVHLRQFALDRAVAEVNQLSGLVVGYDIIKRGRSVVAVDLHWTVKDAADRTATARELAASRVGRKARRDGTAESFVDPEEKEMVIPSFPATGSILYSRWADLAREHLPQPTPDLGAVTRRFRIWMSAQDLSFSIPSIEDDWISFCANWKND